MTTAINGSAGFTTNSGAVYDGIQRATVQTGSGTEVTFTSIPSWAKRITLLLNNVSSNGTTGFAITVGDSTGFYSTGYTTNLGTFSGANTTALNSSTATIQIIPINSAADLANSVVEMLNVQGNTWVFTTYGTITAPRARFGASSITLTNPLDRLKLTINGTDVFDAGAINIIYE